MSTRTTRGGTRRTGEVSGRPALATALGDTDTPTRTQAVGPLAAARSTSAGVAAPLADQDPRARTGEGRHVRCGSDSRPTSRCPPARTGAERCTEPQWPRQPSRPTARPRRPPRPQPPGGYIPTSARVAAPDDPATPGVAPIRGQRPRCPAGATGGPLYRAPGGASAELGSPASTPAGGPPAPGLQSRPTGGIPRDQGSPPRAPFRQRMRFRGWRPALPDRWIGRLPDGRGTRGGGSPASQPSASAARPAGLASTAQSRSRVPGRPGGSPRRTAVT